MIVVVAIVAETMDQTRGAQPAPKVNAHRNVRKNGRKKAADVAVECGDPTRLAGAMPAFQSARLG